MKDLIPYGTGNSRFLKSVENFKTLYPDYDAFVDALVAGTLPIDLNGLNPAGIAQEGSALNKAFFLPDELAAALGIEADDPKVADALRALLDANGDTVSAMPQIAIGSYTGNFVTTKYTTQTRSIDLGLDFTPDMVIVYYQSDATTFTNNAPSNYALTTNPRHIPNPMMIYRQGTTKRGYYSVNASMLNGESSLNGSVLSSSFKLESDTAVGYSSAAQYACMNMSGYTYNWIAFQASGR